MDKQPETSVIAVADLRDLRERIVQQNWTIIKEFIEKGISGYKVSAKDRDAIQLIQKDALEHKFDVLLVFMFDRLGRRDDETPFVVEWFSQHDVEVWSVMEGQQRFDSHVDKLMNYIRYWQASGESLKTSLRTKTRLGQLTEEGHYTGGSIPFGYRAVEKGRVNRRNKPVLDLEVDEDEAAIVRLIFHLYVHEGYGSLRISRHLQELGVRGRKGSNMPNTSINRILKNLIYTGIIKNGESVSPVNEELRIIDDELFDKTQKIMQTRVMPHSDIPLNSRGQSLLVGNIYCAHCGNRLTLTTSGRRKLAPDGTVIRAARARYQCHYNVRHPGECDGQSGYGVAKVDEIIDKVIRIKFAQIAAASKNEIIVKQQQREIELAKRRIQTAKDHLAEKEKDLDDFKNEVIKVIRGISKLDMDLLNALIDETKSNIAQAYINLDKAEKEYTALCDDSKGQQQEYDQLLTWADLYDKCSMDAKKMIVSQFIKSVYVGRDYNIIVNFNVSFEEFQSCILQNGEIVAENNAS